MITEHMEYRFNLLCIVYCTRSLIVINTLNAEISNYEDTGYVNRHKIQLETQPSH